VSLVELVIVMAVGSVLLAISSVFAVDLIGRERLRGAVYDVQGQLQRARAEAVRRNRACRLVVDLQARTFGVYDGMGTASLGDDELIDELQLPESVTLARPTSGSAVQLVSISSTLREATFEPAGTATAGTGLIHLFGGEEYLRISIFGAGGLLVEQWNGASWEIDT
jgi:Tfp pilus assembly protein FimT